jgi:hypothetical protein
MSFLSLAWLRHLFSPATRATQQALEAHGTVVVDPTIPLFNGEAIPRYPDRGVAAPAASPELLLESQADLINDLHQASSFSYTEFDELIRPAIVKYAAYVHLLPASETNHHCGQGGLFRHGLEVARNAAIACEAKVFAMDRWASERHNLTPRWRLCAILGGMVHDLGKPLIDVGAVDPTGQHLWNPHTGSLWEWLQERKLEYYYIQWRPGARFKRHESFTTLALYRIIPDATMRWIGLHGGQEAFDALVMALTGTTDTRNPLCELISKADSKSVDRDIKDSRDRLTAGGQGGRRSLAARLVRAMHDAIEAGKWPINRLGSPIWATTEGIFGMYPRVIQEAIAALRELGETSLPTDASNALDLLSDWGFLHPQIHADGQSTNTWNLLIHTEDRGKPVTFDAHVVKFSREEIIPATALSIRQLHAELLTPHGKVLGSGTVTMPGISPAVGAAASETAVAAPHPVPATASTTPPAAEVPVSTPAASTTPESDPVLRDRTSEIDVRTAALEAAGVAYNSPFPPTTPEGAQAWLEDSAQQPEGDALISIAAKVVSGQLREGEHVFDVDERVHLRSPEAFKDLGFDPIELRTLLESRGWTETDSQVLKRTTVVLEHGGKRFTCTRLTGSLSTVFRLLLPARTQAPPENHFTTRSLALGPRIDSATATRLRELATFDAADGPIIRPIFHTYLRDCAREKGSHPELLTSEQIHGLLKVFGTQHGIRKRDWWVLHALAGNPPVCITQLADRISDPSARHQLTFNTAYDPACERAPEEEVVA